MTASKPTSSSSDSSGASSSAQTPPNLPFGIPPIDPAAVQNLFEQWLNAWKAIADPAQWQKLMTQANPGLGTPGAANAFPGFPGFAAGAGLSPLAMPSLSGLPAMPAMPHIPTAAISPERLKELQASYSRDAMELMQQANAQSIDVSTLKDRRFNTTAWQSTPAFAFTAAWYVLNARYLQELAEAVDADPKTRERIRFGVQQWAAAAAPSNYFVFNPEAQQALIDSRGESLQKGMMNLLADMQRGKIQQSDESGFLVGKNIATTEGSVVFENDLLQLIQYTPRTATVRERPLLIVPPCINKFYILDLQPQGSLVAHALDAGHQVFIISWRNADESIAHKTWDDYIEEGVLTPIEVVKKISGREQLNTLGFCVGGTMLATALSVLAARGEHPAASMTLLTAMLDFSDTGVLDVFIDEQHVKMREQSIGGMNGARPGLMRGLEFANTFSFLRPNDLVWNYVVDNYLKGRTPQAFDLLFWNSDSTNLPGPMFVWYLRNTYLENKLRKPGEVTTCGEPVDLSSIDVPTFLYGSREDHIVPWTAAYASAPLLSGPQKFVLGASGHIAGVINPPAKNKRSFWVLDTDDKTLPEDSDAWFEAATEHPGSWWPTWTEWLDGYGGKKIKPKAQLGSADFPVIEPAPGRYVLKRDQ
jgi:polyhydroxyalkanoate synthase